MSISETLARYDLSKSLILEHGFTENMKDYRLLVELSPQSTTPGRYEFLFLGAIQVQYDMQEETEEASLYSPFGTWNGNGSGGHKNTDGAEPDYPQWSYIEDSELAAEWSARRNMQMHEIKVKASARYLSIVFRDLEIRQE